ncbi:hypothetical protein MBAV_003916 [Candidatus Magnetobacterium bavaricum]|uniref:Uncharacterized protein n=1 Tax=Candidatus Magnetobacterium bavaricum TaxID=29290 RepID=A0A0F3GQ06_9BACT|nr:hypothetical protein MBAV_003916 [Candidatus Magnetobacterium bavaricum]
MSKIIAAILYYSELTHFSGDPEILHRVFHNLRTQCDLLNGLPFSIYDVFPFSPNMEKILFGLER